MLFVFDIFFETLSFNFFSWMYLLYYFLSITFGWSQAKLNSAKSTKLKGSPNNQKMKKSNKTKENKTENKKKKKKKTKQNKTNRQIK